MNTNVNNTALPTEILLGKVNQLSSSIANSLQAPSTGLEVGKFFRIASIGADGKPVLEAVTVGGGGVTIDDTLTITGAAADAAAAGKRQFDFTRYEGKKLNDVFTDADALHDAIAAGDFSKIHVGDYWQFTLNGEFRDYGNYTLISGSSYYSDTACTVEVGTVDADIVVTSVNDANDYCEAKISGTTRYCRITDCLPYNVRTLDNAVMEWVVAAINPYMGYGDNASPIYNKPHVVGFTRDGLPTTLKMRPSVNRWVNADDETFEVTSATGTYTLTDTTKKIRSVRDNGRLLTYNTHYTVSGASITLKAAAAVTVGDTLTIYYTDTDIVQNGMAVNKTLNDTEHGVLRLLQTADAKLHSHIANMRLYAETLTVASVWAGTWTDRGSLFLPLESEVWGENVYSHGGLATYLPQLPLFTSAENRTKGAGKGAARTRWWCGSASSLAIVCNVNGTGYADNYGAYNAYAVPLGFVLS